MNRPLWPTLPTALISQTGSQANEILSRIHADQRGCGRGKHDTNLGCTPTSMTLERIQHRGHRIAGARHEQPTRSLGIAQQLSHGVAQLRSQANGVSIRGPVTLRSSRNDTGRSEVEHIVEKRHACSGHARTEPGAAAYLEQ